MEPHLAEAARAKSEAVSLKERLKAIRTVDSRDKTIEAIETKIWEQEKAATQAKATEDGIDAAVFDLKAVNPNAIVKNDTRTSAEVIKSIQDQGEIVTRALDTLRALLRARVGAILD